jgi:hypothetical protein
LASDIHNNLEVRRAISPVSVADTTPQVSQIIDRKGYDALEFFIETGAIASGTATFAVTMDHGEAANLSDAAPVPSDQMVGTLAAAGFTFANPNVTRKIGYIGGKRYVRLTITPAANAAAALLTAVAVLGKAALLPTP